MKAMATHNAQHIAAALSRLAEAWSEAGDAGRSAEAQELLGKLTDGRLTVALCGHFSAGKSSLVNALCGAKLLPSSPIPTSANVVSIRGGDRPFAEVETERDGKVVREVIPVEELDQYCVDGERFQSVSIVYPSELLGNEVVLLDTPGIDSTDQAHRMATESALHLADVVFYVMDYNHVQSEINFAFAKSLKDWGKPLYFIVNQIDKHRDQELSFDQYARSVEEAFNAWHLEPAGILYLSLRHPEHPHHQWESLLQLIGKLADAKEELCAFSVYASLRHMAQDHLKQREEGIQPRLAALLEEAGGEEGLRRSEEESARLAELMDMAMNARDAFRSGLLRELQTILDNANITPAALRDLAHEFLESRKPGYKAGLFFAGAKTAAEQARRLEAFEAELHGLMDAGVDWHVRQLLRTAGEQIQYDADALEAELGKRLDWRPDDKWLLDKIKPGAVFGNEYTMTYCKEVSADFKSRYRGLALEVIDLLAAHAGKAADSQLASLRLELQEAESKSQAAASLRELEWGEEQYAAALNALLPNAPEQPALPRPKPIPSSAADSGTNSGKRDTETQMSSDSAHIKKKKEISTGVNDDRRSHQHAENPNQFAQGSTLGMQRRTADRLTSAATLLDGHPAMRAAAASMRDKASRLKDSSFTIALFGAFSAGKSSLANAMIGESVLPVSPNPTTAAINRLMPPDEEYGHGSARIVMKTTEELVSDLRYSLALLGEDASEAALPDADAIIESVGRLSPASVGSGGRPHYSFLRAARGGWERHKSQLGQEIKADRDEYISFVAEESRSCFVRSIDFHYDCPLTAEGIVLVDTPGADSVNARHTGVAFNYIKNADAILFVTYYNHAFSQADRQFLDQLGRVKDQFELDKMFFIVNASDLASDEDELQGVLHHVESNLQRHGIMRPRLFPVSSIHALEAKEKRDEEALRASGLFRFETDFQHFVRHDLGQLAVQSAKGEMERVLQLLGGWIASAEGDAETRKAQLDSLERELAGAGDAIRAFGGGAMTEGIKQEIKELLYYVVQRLQYRLGDFYHLAFNPASLQDDGRDLKKAVWTSWLELQRLLQRELSQELQATTLRLERAIGKELSKGHDRCTLSIRELMPDYAAPAFTISSVEAPPEGEAWHEPNVQGKWLWARFKTPRQFFEGDGKGLLRKELEAIVVPSMQEWSETIAEQWQSHYDRVWGFAASLSASNLLEDLAAYGEGKRSSLSDKAALERLKQLRSALIDLGSA